MSHPSSIVRCAKWSPVDITLLATIEQQPGDLGTLSVWDTSTGTCLWRLQCDDKWVSNLHFENVEWSKWNASLLATHSRCRVCVWDHRKRAKVACVMAMWEDCFTRHSMLALTWLDEATLAFNVSLPNDVIVFWNWQAHPHVTDKIASCIGRHTAPFDVLAIPMYLQDHDFGQDQDCTFAAQGPRFALATRRSLSIWNWQERCLESVVPRANDAVHGPVLDMAWCPHNPALLAVNYTGYFEIIQTADDLLMVMQSKYHGMYHTPPGIVEWSPLVPHMLLVTANNRFDVWHKGKRLRTLQPGASPIVRWSTSSPHKLVTMSTRTTRRAKQVTLCGLQTPAAVKLWAVALGGVPVRLLLL